MPIPPIARKKLRIGQLQDDIVEEADPGMDQLLEQTAQVCPDLLSSISSPISLKLCNELRIPIDKNGLHQKLNNLV